MPGRPTSCRVTTSSCPVPGGSLTAGWNLAEALGLPVAGYLAGAMLGERAVGMVAATGVVWLTVAVRRMAAGSVPGCCAVSACTSASPRSNADFH
jgi:hypothetical protein